LQYRNKVQNKCTIKYTENMKDKLKYDNTARIAAGICGLSDNLIRKVVRGDRENEIAFTVFMELKQHEQVAIEKATETYKILTQKTV
jgi:hypothetical protein